MSGKSNKNEHEAFMNKVKNAVKDLNPVTVSGILKEIRDNQLSENTERKKIRTALRELGYATTPPNFWVLPIAGASENGISKQIDAMLEFSPNLTRQEALELLRKSNFDINLALNMQLDSPVIDSPIVDLRDGSDSENLEEITIKILVNKKNKH